MLHHRQLDLEEMIESFKNVNPFIKKSKYIKKCLPNALEIKLL